MIKGFDPEVSLERSERPLTVAIGLYLPLMSNILNQRQSVCLHIVLCLFHVVVYLAPVYHRNASFDGSDQHCASRSRWSMNKVNVIATD